MCDNNNRGIKYVRYIPKDCPRCEGQSAMAEIPGHNEAWKCKQCGLEIWGGSIPTFEEFHDMMHASPKELMKMGGAIKKRGGSKSGRSRKKPRKMIKNYYFEYNKKSK